MKENFKISYLNGKTFEMMGKFFQERVDIKDGFLTYVIFHQRRQDKECIWIGNHRHTSQHARSAEVGVWVFCEEAGGSAQLWHSAREGPTGL